MKTITSSRSINLPVALMLCLVCALVLTTTVSSEAPKNIRADKAKEANRMFDIAPGSRAGFQLGRETTNHYLGALALQDAMQAGKVEPRTIVTDDFNGDAMGDLVIGYANNGGGILSFRTGNVQAIAPADREVFEGIQQGSYPSPFLPEARLYALPEVPDFLQVGDFNADGYEDVLAAARGGATLYFVAGDGHGTLRAPQSFEVSGSLTALQADDFKQPGRFTRLALGVRTLEGPKTLIYDQSELSGEPDSYPMAAEVTALAFGQLDDDGITDLAAATTNEVTVIHGRSHQASQSAAAMIERQNLPFEIRGLAVGDFVFDRNHQREIAALSADGAVYLSARGNPDTRPYTKEEKNTLRELKRSFTLDKIDMETLIAETNKLIRANRTGGWNVAEMMSSGITPSPAGGSLALFQRLNASNLPTDDLLIGDGASNRVQVVKNEQDAAKLNIESRNQSAETGALTVEGAPLAAVSLRLGVDIRPGMVILRAGQIEPEVSILAPDATFNVTSTADLADDAPTAADAVCLASNGQCTLRAAIMQSNHTGGSNTITVPDGTYTISLGAPDDEANTGGATEQSGDLDIFNWNPFDASPVLTAVSITGASRDGTIINMGTFDSTLGTNVPNNKERILEINDGATIQSKINVTLTNLTFQNGVSPTGSGTFLDGGAIWYDGSDANANTNIGLLTLHNVKVANNTSAGAGGGVLGQFGSLKIESTSIISGNTSQHKVGGGVEYNGGNTVETQTLVIDGSTIGGANVSDGNTASDSTFGAGGGLDTRGGAGVTITNGTVIRHNVANTITGLNGGGGIQIGNGATFAFSNSTITENTSRNHAGGLLSNALTLAGGNATVTLTGMTITGNIADSENNGVGDGGGIYNFAGSLVIQTTSHIDGNTAVNGGGIFSTWNNNTINTSANLTMTGGTVGQSGVGNGNNAKNNGGGIAVSPGAATTFGTINLNSINITNNAANSDSVGGGDGGGIFVSSGNLSSLNGCTIDSNVANSGTGDGIFQNGGTITAAGTVSLSGDDSLSINAGTFTSTSATLNIAGNFTRSTGGAFTHNSGTLNFNGSGAQNINGTATSESFNHFTVNKGGGTLTGGGSTTSLTINGNITLSAGTFKAGTLTAIGLPIGNWTNNGGVFTPDSSVVSFTNTSGAQSINGTNASQTFNSITVAKTAQTLSVAGSTTSLTLNGTMTLTSGTFAAGTATAINVGGNWTNNGGTFTPGTGTVTFNGGGAQTIGGTATTQSFNNFTVSKGAGTLTGGGSTTTLTVNGNLSITAGTFAAGTITTLNVAGNWANTPGTFTSGSSTVVFNGNNNTQTLTGTTSFNNLTSNHTGTGGVTASGSSLTVTGLLRIQAGTFTSSSTLNNVQIDSGTTLASDGSTMNVSGNWTNNGGTFTPNGNTVNFNGAAAQIISGSASTQTFDNFTVNKTVGPTLTVAASTNTLDINGNVTLTLGTFAAGTATAITVAGNWTNNGGVFTPGTGTVTFDGGVGQAIGGTTATTFNNLTNGNANGLAMNNDNTVNGILALASSDITVAATKTLTQPVTGSSSGGFDVNGRVQRTGFVNGGGALSFGNPLNTIQVTAGTAPANIVVDLTRSAPTGGQGFPTAVQRTYTITPSAGGFTGTLRLHYLDSELNGNIEGPDFIFRRFNGTGWAPVLPTSSDFVNNWLEATGVTQFSAWTFNSTFTPTASNGVVTGRIVDNNDVAVEGAVIRLTGTQNRKFITDANGFYRFDNVETNGFYTVTPSRANYTFSPAARSFSQIGQATEATFGATLTSSGFVNPLDTPEYYVRQHYLDFLGREPDESGFNFWSDQILECGTDNQCIERRRENVSAAYFLSIEFQQTGGLVDGLYRASYGVRPNFAEFMPDTRAVAQGVVVGQDGWQAKLQANKEAFVAAFANRSAFHAAFDSLSNEDYVATLINHTGVAFTAGERDALVSGLANGTLTRAAVLQSIAENQGFINAKFKDAFVMMEYFGYLRRDADASGFAFWLNKLNEFGGNFEQAEMVKAFIVSSEYRGRFPK